jgi:hypothetical protein
MLLEQSTTRQGYGLFLRDFYKFKHLAQNLSPAPSCSLRKSGEPHRMRAKFISGSHQRHKPESLWAEITRKTVIPRGGVLFRM